MCDQPHDRGTQLQPDVPAHPGKAPTLRVLIVGDDIRVRRALRGLIECAPDLTVDGEAGCTQSARRLDLELSPDVVVLDLLLRQAMDGMGFLLELRRHGRPVVAISGFLEKHGRDVDDLLDMIRAAYRQNPWPAGG